MSFFFFPKCLHVFLFFYTLQDRIGTLMGGRGFRRSQPHNHITRILWRKSHVLLKLNSSFFSLSGSVPMPSLSGLYTVTKKYRCGTCRGWMPAKSLQSCLTLWDPMDHSPPSSSVHGILQARILEWVVMPSSRGSSQPGSNWHLLCFLFIFSTLCK